MQHEPVYERAINSYILYCRIIALHYGKIKYQYIYDVFSGFHLWYSLKWTKTICLVASWRSERRKSDIPFCDLWDALHPSDLTCELVVGRPLLYLGGNPSHGNVPGGPQPIRWLRGGGAHGALPLRSCIAWWSWTIWWTKCGSSDPTAGGPGAA